MDREKTKKLLAWASDEKRLDAAIERVSQGIADGSIDPASFPMPAGPLTFDTERERQWFINFLQEVCGQSLSSEQTDLLQQVMGSLPGGTTLPDLLDALEKNEALASWATALRSQTTA